MKADRPYRKSTVPENAKCVFEGVLFDVYQWEQELYDGSTAVFERLVGNDIAKVIPVLPDGSILIVKDEQPARTPLIKFPGGYVDEGETPEQCVQRELLEETGYKPGTLEFFFEIAPWNKVDYKRIYYIAKDCTRVAEPLTQAGEKVTQSLVSFDELMPLLCQGELDDQAMQIRALKASLDKVEYVALRSALGIYDSHT
jgi:ADP-ribose pyrophosphatase